MKCYCHTCIAESVIRERVPLVGVRVECPECQGTKACQGCEGVSCPNCGGHGECPHCKGYGDVYV